MKNNDLIQKRANLRQKMAEAIRNEDSEAFDQAMDEQVELIASGVREEMAQQVEEIRQDMDRRILESRGVRQLTSAEREYFTAVCQAMKDKNPQQALANLPVIMPQTVIESVFEDLRTEHKLLSRIDFVDTGAAVKMLMNAGAPGMAVWGELCADIVKEAAGGFKVVNTNLCKLSAFLLVCKEALELGPEWLDRYVREVLYEYCANGLENGIINGTGNDQPIGMIRDVSDDATVVGGVYPEKEKIAVNELDIKAMGNLFAMMAMDGAGNPRAVNGVIMIVNSADYYGKVMPAVMVLMPDGTYHNIVPYMSPDDIIQSAFVPRGTAIMGIAKRYFMAIGNSKDGGIEYDDSAKFIEDKRAYIVKLYGNGMPKDNNAFLWLDISAIQPIQYKVVSATERTASSDATLASLKVGAALSTTFDPETTTYTATTTKKTGIISAVAADAGASVEVKLGTAVIANGASVEWATGSNTVTVTVTAEDGTTDETYTVTVTKS